MTHPFCFVGSSSLNIVASLTTALYAWNKHIFSGIWQGTERNLQGIADQTIDFPIQSYWSPNPMEMIF